MKFLSKRPGKRGRSVVRTLVPVLPQFLRLLGGLVTDRRVPLADKGMVGVVLLYIILPIDLVPDFLGLLGWTDDLFLLALALRRLISRAGEPVIEAHWHGSDESLEKLRVSLDELGALLPGPVRKVIEGYAAHW